jgi:hypothetical protein
MLFERQVTIRLADDFSAFVSTVRYAKLFAKVTEYSLGQRAASEAPEDRAFAELRSPHSLPKARDVHHSE